jgi:hypothetical protein
MTDPKPLPGNETGRRVSAYFSAMREAFSRARQHEGQTVHRTLAGRTVRFDIAGNDLSTVLQTALAHLPPTAASSADLIIRAWDESVTEIPLPDAPWQWPPADSPNGISFPPGAENFQPHLESPSGAFALHDLAQNEVILHVRDARLLPTYWHGSPLFRNFHVWAQQAGLAILHAACIGTDHGAALLAGKGGSGKSTTALLCLQAGLRYVSDDYCLLEPGAPPRAHCLYNTGKLQRDHLARFPALAQQADPHSDQFEKKVVFAHQHYPHSLAPSLPLCAIFLPFVSGESDHRIERITPGIALRGLAPSTLFQLTAPSPQHLRMMAELTRQLPCYQLALGTDFDSIPAFIRNHLNSV